MDRSSGDSGKRLYLKFLLGFRGKGNFDSSFVLLHLEPIEKKSKRKLLLLTKAGLRECSDTYSQ